MTQFDANMTQIWVQFFVAPCNTKENFMKAYKRPLQHFLEHHLNLFHANGLFLYSLKT